MAATRTPRFTRGFVIAMFSGPGRFSLDRALGVDGRWARPFGTTRAA